MPSNPFLIPPRALGRALDDLHAIAEAARTLPLNEGDPKRVVREALEDLESVADASKRLTEVERNLTERVDRVESRLREREKRDGYEQAKAKQVHPVAIKRNHPLARVGTSASTASVRLN